MDDIIPLDAPIPPQLPVYVWVRPMSDLDGLPPAEIAVLRTMADLTQTAALVDGLRQLGVAI